MMKAVLALVLAVLSASVAVPTPAAAVNAKVVDNRIAKLEDKVDKMSHFDYCWDYCSTSDCPNSCKYQGGDYCANC